MNALFYSSRKPVFLLKERTVSRKWNDNRQSSNSRQQLVNEMSRINWELLTH